LNELWSLDMEAGGGGGANGRTSPAVEKLFRLFLVVCLSPGRAPLSEGSGAAEDRGPEEDMLREERLPCRPGADLDFARATAAAEEDAEETFEWAR
jgi:hypothetical protein